MFTHSKPSVSIKKNQHTDLKNLICSMICIFLFSACGPISSYRHTALDTPSRHVDNGLKFLQINKIDAAVLEFSRAAELDPEYAPAYTGLGLANKARGYEQESAVKDARVQLDTLKKNL